jgi:TonB family protein
MLTPLNIAGPAPSRDARGTRLLVAVCLSVALHAGAAMAMAATPGDSTGARSKSAHAPLQTRLAADANARAASRPPFATGSTAAAASGPAKPAGGAVSPIYFKPSQLDARPHIVTRVDPVYPSGVPPSGGKARIRLFINERGFVDRVAIEDSAASDKFGVAAATAFRSAQFAPGKLKGVAVKSQVLIEVDFPSLLPPGVK